MTPSRCCIWQVFLQCLKSAIHAHSEVQIVKWVIHTISLLPPPDDRMGTKGAAAKSSFEHTCCLLRQLQWHKSCGMQVFLEGLKSAMQADAEFKGGWYDPQKPPVLGPRAFARVYAGWGLSQAFYWEKVQKLQCYCCFACFLLLCMFLFCFPQTCIALPSFNSAKKLFAPD